MGIIAVILGVGLVALLVLYNAFSWGYVTFMLYNWFIPRILYPLMAKNTHRTVSTVLFRLFQIALVGGVVFLAATGKEGWGWLIFILALTIA